MKDKFITFYKTIEIPRIHSLLLTFFCYETMKAIQADAGWTVCVAVCVLCYIAAQRLASNFRKINTSLTKLWQVLVFFLLYFYFVFSLLGSALLEPSGLNAFSLEHYLFLPMALIWPFPLFLQILVWMDMVFSRSLSGETRFPLKWKVLAFTALAVNYALWLAAFNPCISTFDSALLFNKAHVMGIEPMLNWHPPFYAIVMHFLIKICDSAAFLIGVQCAAFAFLILRLLTLLLKKGISKKAAVVLYLVLGFAFNNVIQMITLWKDIPYMISLLWLTVLLAELVLTNGKISRIWHVEFSLSLLFTALFRQNGIIPAIAAAIFITVYLIRRRKFLSLIPIAAFLLAFVLVEGPIYDYYKVQEVPGLKYIALSNDIMETYYDGCDSSDDVKQIVNLITDQNPEHWKFNSYYIQDYNSDALDDYSVPKFMSVYMRTLFEHPSEMVSALAKRNSMIWSLTKPHKEFVSYVNELGEWHQDPEYQHTYPFRVKIALTDVLTAISNKLTQNYLVYVIAWRTAIYFLAILFLLYFTARKRKMFFFLPFVPILFNVLSLIAGSGWSDYRYYWPTAVIAVFLMGYTRIVLASGKEDAKRMAPKEACPADSSGIESK